MRSKWIPIRAGIFLLSTVLTLSQILSCARSVDTTNYDTTVQTAEFEALQKNRGKGVGYLSYRLADLAENLKQFQARRQQHCATLGNSLAEACSFEFFVGDVLKITFRFREVDVEHRIVRQTHYQALSVLRMGRDGRHLHVLEPDDSPTDGRKIFFFFSRNEAVYQLEAVLSVPVLVNKSGKYALNSEMEVYAAFRDPDDIPALRRFASKKSLRRIRK